MTAKQLIDYLSLIEPNTELGIYMGYRKEPLKSMTSIGNTLYLTNGNWAPTQEEMNKFDVNSILSSLARFAKPTDCDKGYKDCINKAKELLGIDLESQFKNVTREKNNNTSEEKKTCKYCKYQDSLYTRCKKHGLYAADYNSCKLFESIRINYEHNYH